MSKKFVVSVEGLSVEEQILLRDFIVKDASGWWHMIEGIWLVVAVTDRLTVSNIRNEIMNISKASKMLVLEVSPITWAALGPESEDHSFSRWVKEYWTANE